jgi:hypothetical protein
LQHVQIHDTGNGRLHEEEGAVHCYVHQPCSDLLYYDSSKRCVCPLYKFVYSFKVLKLCLKHSILSCSLLVLRQRAQGATLLCSGGSRFQCPQ